MNFKKRITLAVLATALFASITFVEQRTQAQAGAATSFYDLDVIAVSGQNNLVSLFAAPSINEKGIVSFVGNTGGNNIFTSESPGTYRRLNPGGTVNVFAGNSQIADNNQIVALETIVGLNQQLLEVWDGNTEDIRVVVAGSSTFFNDFAAIRPNPSMNNNGLPVFSAQAKVTFQTRLVTGTRQGFFNQLALPHPLKPMIADDGEVIVRAGNTITSPITMYQFNLTMPQTIAASPEFTQLGDGPGISDNSKAIVFFGDPAAMIGGSDQPGVFACIDDETGTRKRLRLTGRTVELGRDAMGNPIGFDPASILSFNRVTVIYQELGNVGPDGDSFTACFQATPTAASPDGLFTAANGLWTVRTDIKLVAGVLEYTTLGPIPVVQIGSVVGGRTITDIVVNDAISTVNSDTIDGILRASHLGENRVAFFASTNAGDIAVRASYLDPDEDNLPSHWETRGVDFGAGLIDLSAMAQVLFTKTCSCTLIGCNRMRE
ncbi:MAG: hypothetical protein AABO41_17615 [Acidobacteriota bacterium]